MLSPGTRDGQGLITRYQLYTALAYHQVLELRTSYIQVINEYQRYAGSAYHRVLKLPLTKKPYLALFRMSIINGSKIIILYQGIDWQPMDKSREIAMRASASSFQSNTF